jgi:GNAT superfamily N-acetyltransferase
MFNEISKNIDIPNIKSLNFKDKDTYKQYFNKIKDLIFALDKEEDVYIKYWNDAYKRKIDKNFFDDLDVWIIEDNTIITSMIIGYYNPNIPKIYNIKFLYINPKYRKQGFASALLNEVIVYCRLKKYNGLMLKCFNENISAYSLYTKFGFNPVSSDLYKKL